MNLGYKIDRTFVRTFQEALDRTKQWSLGQNVKFPITKELVKDRYYYNNLEVKHGQFTGKRY